MASRIAGITVEIDANASKFQSSIKSMDKELKTTKSTLKDIDKLLKLDPTNTELLTQKQKALKTAIQETKDRLQLLKDEQKNVSEGTAEWDALQREIIATEQELKSLEKEYKEFGSVSAQQLKAIGKEMQEFGNKVQDVGKKLSVISGAAAAALTALGKIGYDAIKAADDIKTLSQQTGISTDTLQKWKYSADLVDVSFESMTSAVTKVKKGMAGSEATWKKLGVSVRDASGKMRNAEDVFYDTVVALSKIENETEKDQIAMSIFGKNADELAGIIDDGGKSLKDYGDEAERLGLIMGGDTLDMLGKASDTIDKLKANTQMSLNILGGTLVETFAPVLENISTLLGNITEAIRNLTPEQVETITTILSIVAVAGPLVLIIGKIITGIGGLISAISAISTALTVSSGVVGLVIIAIAALIAAGVWLYNHWDEVKAWAIDLWEKIKEVWDGIKETITETWNNIKEKTSEIWNNIKNAVLTAVLTLVTPIIVAWTTVRDGVVNAVTALRDRVVGAWENLKSKIMSVVNGIKQQIDNFKQKIEDAKNAVTGAINNIRNALNTTLSFPHIKVPHFRITGGVVPWGIGGAGTPPTINIDWYKKAYDNPVMFSSPTVIPTASGAKGFGDGHGAEIVMSLNKLQQLVGASGDITINVYATEGMNTTELAIKIQDKLVQLQKQREMAYA